MSFSDPTEQSHHRTLQPVAPHPCFHATVAAQMSERPGAPGLQHKAIAAQGAAAHLPNPALPAALLDYFKPGRVRFSTVATHVHPPLHPGEVAFSEQRADFSA